MPTASLALSMMDLSPVVVLVVLVVLVLPVVGAVVLDFAASFSLEALSDMAWVVDFWESGTRSLRAEVSICG